MQMTLLTLKAILERNLCLQGKNGIELLHVHWLRENSDFFEQKTTTTTTRLKQWQKLKIFSLPE